MTDEVRPELAQVGEAVEAQTAAMMRMLGIMSAHTEMLKQILAAVTAEPEGDSPLIEALQQLIRIGESHSSALERIENTISTGDR